MIYIFPIDFTLNNEAVNFNLKAPAEIPIVIVLENVLYDDLTVVLYDDLTNVTYDE